MEHFGQVALELVVDKGYTLVLFLPAMSRQESVRLAVMRCAARRKAERQRKSSIYGYKKKEKKSETTRWAAPRPAERQRKAKIDAQKKEQKSRKQQKSQKQQKSKPDRSVSFNYSDQENGSVHSPTKEI